MDTARKEEIIKFLENEIKKKETLKTKVLSPVLIDSEIRRLNLLKEIVKA